MVNLQCDLAMRTGKFKVYMAIFNNYAPKLFNIDNPRQTLSLSLIPAKRKTQVQLYLNGINPHGLVSIAELHKHYARGVTVNGKNLDTYEAVAHILSRTLPITANKVQEVIEDKFVKGFKEIVFITSANLKNAERESGNEWKVVAEVPPENQRLDGLNELLKNAQSKYRAVTDKTYVTKVYGA